MKPLYFLIFICAINFAYSQNNAQITCYQTLICKNGTATLSSATSVANTPILYSLWNITGPNNFQVTDTSFVGEDFTTNLPYVGFYDVNLLNVHEDLTTSFDQEFQFLNVYEVNASFAPVISGAVEYNGNPYYCPPLVGNFTNTSNSIFPLQSFEWQFTNQNLAFNQIIDTNENPYGIQFLYPGHIDFQFVVFDSNQCSDTIFIQDALVIIGPIAECNYSQTGYSNFMEYNFSVSNLENVASLEWHLGNGEIINDLDGFTYTYSSNGLYNAYVTASDANGCVVHYPLGELLPGINSVYKLSQKKFYIHPNPSSDYMTINNENYSTISIQDINGKQIAQELFSISGNKIDIRTLDSGIYFLNLDDESFKIVKN